MVQDKQLSKSRQGALFAYERLFFELGSRFEPYVVHILPNLLSSKSELEFLITTTSIHSLFFDFC